ncbi:hypothetical protein O1L60_34460 [Streptomyces diastatochromogenes]|nr:hypothetical protein [Streptomyces diastatochromogenes]
MTPALTRAHDLYTRAGADAEADRVRADLERATRRPGRRAAASGRAPTRAGTRSRTRNARWPG